MAMLKEDFINVIFEETGTSKANAKRTFERIVKEMTDSLNKSEPVKINNIGTLKVIHRSARRRYVPTFKDYVDVPAKNVIKFVASSAIKK